MLSHGLMLILRYFLKQLNRSAYPNLFYSLYPFGLVLKTILHPSDSPVWCNVFAISYSSSSNTLKESSLSIYDHSFPAPTSYETSQVRIEFSPTNIGSTYHSGADILQSTRRYRINVIYIKCHCLCGFFLSPTSNLKQITFRVCNIEISYAKWEGFRFSRK